MSTDQARSRFPRPRPCRDVRDILQPSDDICEADRLLTTARRMRDVGVEALLLCDSNGRIRRVVTDRELASAALSRGVAASSVPPSTPLPTPSLGSGVASPPVPGQPAGRCRDSAASEPAAAGGPRNPVVRAAVHRI